MTFLKFYLVLIISAEFPETVSTLRIWLNVVNKKYWFLLSLMQKTGNMDNWIIANQEIYSMTCACIQYMNTNTYIPRPRPIEYSVKMVVHFQLYSVWLVAKSNKNVKLCDQNSLLPCDINFDVHGPDLSQIEPFQPW